MSNIYKDCPYCLQPIVKKPVLQKLQGRFSILCPFCLAHRSAWVATKEEAITSWNTHGREGTTDIFYIPLPLELRQPALNPAP